jgi:hypothetical protein
MSGTYVLLHLYLLVYIFTCTLHCTFQYPNLKSLGLGQSIHISVPNYPTERFPLSLVLWTSRSIRLEFLVNEGTCLAIKSGVLAVNQGREGAVSALDRCQSISSHLIGMVIM